MQKEQLTLLALIRSALWGDAPPDDPGAALNIAREQMLMPLLFPDTTEAGSCTAHSVRLLFAEDGAIALFRSAGIDAVVLKGAAAACLYPDPLRRTMGDVDLIVPPDMFDDACRVFDENGYRRGSDYDSDSRHKPYAKDGVDFELHHHYSFDGIDVERFVTEGVARFETVDVEGHEVPILPPLENGITLLAHLANHLKNSLGLRQVIDWMMYAHAHLSNGEWEREFRAAASSCGLEALAVAVTRLCKKYLGLPDGVTWCDGADDETVDALLESLLSSGNFGASRGAGANVENVSVGIRRYGFFRYLQMAGEHNWKAYHRHRWLKPFCSVYQVFRYARQAVGARRGKKLSDDLDRANERYELLRRLGID